MIGWILLVIGILIAAWIVFALIKGIVKIAMVLGIILVIVVAGSFIYDKLQSNITGASVKDTANNVKQDIQQHGSEAINSTKDKIIEIIVVNKN